MAKITWLGSEDYREGESPLESCEWNGVLFTAGDRVEVADEWMINKARGNRFFRVEDNTAPLGPAKPEMWTNDGMPPDYPPEDEPDRPKRRGRPPRIRDNGDADQ